MTNENELIRYDVLCRALCELGVKETPGKTHTNRILQYHSATTLKATKDEVPWCSSFVNYVCETEGLNRTKSASARSWLKIGTKTSEPSPGDIAVFSRGKPGQGHVGFFLARRGKYIYLLGGNQGNAVSVKTQLASNLLAYIDVTSLVKTSTSSRDVIPPPSTEEAVAYGKLLADYPKAWEDTPVDILPDFFEVLDVDHKSKTITLGTPPESKTFMNKVRGFLSGKKGKK